MLGRCCPVSPKRRPRCWDYGVSGFFSSRDGGSVGSAVGSPKYSQIRRDGRGLFAAWLYQAIQRLGWHPMLRVKEDLSFRATGEETFSPMGQWVKRRGRGWSGKGEWSEHGERMEGTVLIRWEKGYEEKLVVVTDLNEKEANAA